MAAYGAEVILAPSMEGARDMLREMERKGLGHCLDQYNNEDNTDSHYRGTGEQTAWDVSFGEGGMYCLNYEYRQTLPQHW